MHATVSGKKIIGMITTLFVLVVFIYISSEGVREGEFAFQAPSQSKLWNIET